MLPPPHHAFAQTVEQPESNQVQAAPIVSNNVRVAVTDCFSGDHNRFARATITNNGSLPLERVVIQIVGFDTKGDKYGPWTVTYEGTGDFTNGVVEPGFTDEGASTLMPRHEVSYAACEATIYSVTFADKPTVILPSVNPLQDKLDEFETRISNLESGGTGTGTTPQDNTRITTLETKVNALEAMVNTIQQSIANLRNMINDIISGDPVDPTPAPLSGTVFRDSNSNGIMDAGELGLPNTQITAIDLNPTNTGNVTVTTDQNGMYKFNTLTPGTYFVLSPSASNNDFVTITANQPQTHNVAIP